MAKGARGVDRRQVKEWFSGLSFEVQQSVLDEFGKAVEAKADRISALEKELAELRGKPAGGPAAVKSGTHALTSERGAKPGSKVSPKKGIKIEPKYRHPTTGQTWAGRGVQPTWMVEYLKKRGNKLEDLLIKKESLLGLYQKGGAAVRAALCCAQCRAIGRLLAAMWNGWGAPNPLSRVSVR